MRLFDTSFYYGDQTTENYLIEVLPVNKNQWVTYNVARGFSLVLNSANLGYKKVSSEDGLTAIPDGIYEIKQSFKPNLKTVVQYYHLRIVDLSMDLARERSKLMCDECKLTREEYKENRDRLRDIEEYMYAAKWMIEECGDKAKGKELYEYSKKLLEQYTNECQC